MKKILICLFTLLAIAANAKNNKIYTYQEVGWKPKYSEGNEKLKSYIENNKKIPANLQDSVISGTVTISFIISEIGETSDYQIAKSLQPILDTQALQIVQSLPGKWSAGKIDGRPVIVKNTIDITYTTNKAQKETQKENIFVRVEQMPVYPGGELQLRQDLKDNLIYPAEAKAQGLTGRVYVSFFVDETGNIVDISVARGVHPLLDEAAVQTVKSLNKTWEPAQQGGKKIKLEFTIPINFILDDEKK